MSSLSGPSSREGNMGNVDIREKEMWTFHHPLSQHAFGPDQSCVSSPKFQLVTEQSRHRAVSPHGAIASPCGRAAVQPQVSRGWLCTSRNAVTPVSPPPWNRGPAAWKTGIFHCKHKHRALQPWASQGYSKVNLNANVTCPASAKADLRTGLWPPSLTSELGSGWGKCGCPWPLFFYMLCWWLIIIFLTCPVQCS